MPTQPQLPQSYYTTPSRRSPRQSSLPVSSAIPFEEQARRIIEINKCRADPVYFISNYLYIYEEWDKFGKGFKIFELWPKQVGCIRFIEQAYKLGWQEIVIEKCRRMGASLLISGLGLYHWLFDKDFSMLMGTLNENKIKLIPGHDTLFAKLRDYLEHLPEWMLPKSFELDKHLTSMNLYNPETGNTIKGELLTANFGRGPRSGWVFRDEAAFPTEDTSENTIHTAQLNIDASTVNGLNFFHYNGEAAAKYNPSRKFVFDYWDNPFFTEQYMQEEEFRARQKGAASYSKFRREMFRDKRAIAEGLIYPMIENVPRGEYEFNPDFQTFCIWDFGYADMGVMGILQRDPDNTNLFLLEEIVMNRVGIEWFVPFVPGAPPVLNVAYRYEPEELDKQNRIKTYQANRAVRHYGDKTGNQRTAAQGKSVFDILLEYKIRVRCGAGWNNMNLRQNSTNALLPRLHIHNRCDYFYDSFTQFSVPKRQENNQSTNPSTKGVHTWSHFPSALEAFAISEPPIDFDEPQETVLKEDRYQVVR